MIKEFSTHLQRFFRIVTTIFSFVFMVHLYFFLTNTAIVVDGVILSKTVSGFAVVISALMIILSLSYSRLLKSQKAE